MTRHALWYLVTLAFISVTTIARSSVAASATRSASRVRAALFVGEQNGSSLTVPQAPVPTRFERASHRRSAAPERPRRNSNGSSPGFGSRSGAGLRFGKAKSQNRWRCV